MYWNLITSCNRRSRDARYCLGREVVLNPKLDVRSKWCVSPRESCHRKSVWILGTHDDMIGENLIRRYITFASIDSIQPNCILVYRVLSFYFGVDRSQKGGEIGWGHHFDRPRGLCFMYFQSRVAHGGVLLYESVQQALYVYKLKSWGRKIKWRSWNDVR